MISFDINNKQEILLTQTQHNKSVNVYTINSKGIQTNEYEISNGDFIMLLNYYKFIKEKNILCDFINPNGKECL